MRAVHFVLLTRAGQPGASTVLVMPRWGFYETLWGGDTFDHIFSSQDSSFAKDIMRMTNGKGVDVIMDAVAGETLRITWECIALFNRFIELLIRDYIINPRLEIHKFARNVTFAVVNLVSLVRERPRIAAHRFFLNISVLPRTGIVVEIVRKMMNGFFDAEDRCSCTPSRIYHKILIPAL